MLLVREAWLFHDLHSRALVAMLVIGWGIMIVAGNNLGSLLLVSLPPPSPPHPQWVCVQSLGTGLCSVTGNNLGFQSFVTIH